MLRIRKGKMRCGVVWMQQPVSLTIACLTFVAFCSLGCHDKSTEANPNGNQDAQASKSEPQPKSTTTNEGRNPQTPDSTAGDVARDTLSSTRTAGASSPNVPSASRPVTRENEGRSSAAQNEGMPEEAGREKNQRENDTRALSPNTAIQRGKKLVADARKFSQAGNLAEAFTAATEAWEITHAIEGNPECAAIARTAIELAREYGEAVNKSRPQKRYRKPVTVK